MTFSEEELEIHDEDDNMVNSEKTDDKCARWSKLSRYHIKHIIIIKPKKQFSDHLTWGGTTHSPPLVVSAKMQI